MLKQLFLTAILTLICHSQLSAKYDLQPPYNTGHLRVSPNHIIYYEERGNPEGEPVLVVHGGPGWGCPPAFSRFFDHDHYRVILFDQRGANRSKPFGLMKDNTTQHLVGDMEKLREHLDIDQWLLFGGSWGSTLSLAYGETHPDRCTGFILRGIFLGRQQDANHLVYGMRATFPEAWEEFANFIPAEERGDLMQAYYRRVMDPDPAVHLPAARAFMRYDITCATLIQDQREIESFLTHDKMILGTARTYFYYAANNYFLEDNQLLNNIDKISHLPCTIVHGRYDTICRPEGAFALHKAWPGSSLQFISDAGHSSGEKSIERALVKAVDRFKLETESAVESSFETVENQL